MQLSLKLNELNILLSTIKVNVYLGSFSFSKETIWDLQDIQNIIGMIREGMKYKNINIPFKGGIQEKYWPNNHVKYYPNIQVQLSAECWT